MNLLVDTSVVVKWFHARGERDVHDSRALLEAHLDGRVTASVLDLTMYELGNVLLGPLRRSVDQADTVLGILATACEAIQPDECERRRCRARDRARPHVLRRGVRRRRATPRARSRHRRWQAARRRSGDQRTRRHAVGREDPRPRRPPRAGHPMTQGLDRLANSALTATRVGRDP